MRGRLLSSDHGWGRFRKCGAVEAADTHTLTHTHTLTVRDLSVDGKASSVTDLPHDFHQAPL